MSSYKRKAKRRKAQLEAPKPPRHCGVHAKMSDIGLWRCPKCGQYVLKGQANAEPDLNTDEIPNVIDAEIVETTPLKAAGSEDE